MRLHFCLALALLVAHPQAASPQSPSSSTTETAPWHVAFIDGQATLTRDSLTEELSESQPLIDGDRLRTRPGRLELRSANGALLVLDRDTTVDILGDTVVRLVEGRVRLVNDLDENAGRGSWQVLSPVASLQLDQPGEFDLALETASAEPRLVVSVLRGRGRVESLRGSLEVSTGGRAVARDLDEPRVIDEPFDWQDPFSLWVARRLEAWAPTTSASYLPQTLGGYSSTLDAYGSWEPYDYGGASAYVWFPRVDVGWRPYMTGRWARAGRFGWTWIGVDPWAWPTHHYGRWGFTPGGRWYWIPGPTWGPAWVEWAIGPGYVGWCPLGWDNRPLISFNLFWGFGGDWGRRAYYGLGYDSWVVVRSDRFHRGDRVRPHAVDVRTLADRDRRAFVTQRTPPPSRQPGFAVRRPQAVPRSDWSDRPGSAGNRNLPWRQQERAETGARSDVGRQASPGRDAVPRNPSAIRDRGGAALPLGRRDSEFGTRAGAATPRSPSGLREDPGRPASEIPRRTETGDRWSSPRLGEPSGTRARPAPSPGERPQRVPDAWQRSAPSPSPADRPPSGGGASLRVAPRGSGSGSRERTPTGGGASLSVVPRGGASGYRDRGGVTQSRPRSPQMSAPRGGSGTPPAARGMGSGGASPGGGASRSTGSASGSSRGGSSRGAAPRSRPRP